MILQKINYLTKILKLMKFTANQLITFLFVFFLAACQNESREMTWRYNSDTENNSEIIRDYLSPESKEKGEVILEISVPKGVVVVKSKKLKSKHSI